MIMDLWLIRLEPAIRLVCFVSFFVLLGLWQYHRAHKTVLAPLKDRWFKHFGLLVSCVTLSKALFLSMMPLEVAMEVNFSKIGILYLPSFAFLSYGAKVIISILMLDLALYVQHRALHKISLAWRFHKVHHTDKEVELSTGLRFHPLEWLMNLGVKIAAIIFIGAPVLAVLLFEILLNFALLFSHTNVEIPENIESMLRYVLVTPAMHRIHHSNLEHEYRSNFGFIFSLWDRLFSTYMADPQLGEVHMNEGLIEYRDPSYQSFKMMLWAPFTRLRKKTGLSLKAHMDGPF